jgi:arginine decarboxylase
MQSYLDLLKLTFYFDTPDFTVENGELYFHGVHLKPIVEQYGTPLRLTYRPKISENIARARAYFQKAMERVGYQGSYHYCYCTKSSHFSFVLEEAVKNGVHLETSSTFDIEIAKRLHQKGLIDTDLMVVCNGFKRKEYSQKIVELIGAGFQNCMPVLDNAAELEAYVQADLPEVKLGIRIATEEEPNFAFYTSRLGISYKDVTTLYKEKIATNPKFKLKLLHFFVNSGIKDTLYFWSELNKFIYKYCELKKICPDLQYLDIGGGLPIKNSLGFEYNYQYMIDTIIENVQKACQKEGVPVPDVLTEFGSFTVGESGAMIFSVIGQKQQNDRECWYMLDGSMITHLPDIWGMNHKFILLPLTNWEKPYQQVHLGGITCDSLDYYDSEVHIAKLMLPEITENEPFYVGFFNTGAYQESLGGYGGIQHCLVPAARHVIIDREPDGTVRTTLFRKEQDEDTVMEILGY